MKYLFLLWLCFACSDDLVLSQVAQPTNLETTIIQGGVRLTWEDNSSNELGFEIWASIDNGEYVLIGSVAANVETYDDLREGSFSMKYKVRARGPDNVSQFTSVATSEPLEFVFTSTGDGSGVGTLNFEFSQTTTMSISGTGRFYTNAAGTEGESTTAVVTVGDLRRFYVKVPSGVATLRIKNVVTKWGDNFSGSAVADDGWSTPNIPNDDPDLQGINYPSVSTDCSKLIYCTSINIFGLNTIYGDITALTDMTYMEIGTGQNNHTQATHGSTVTGDISGMSDLNTLDTWDKTHFTGDISGLIAMKVIWLGGLSSITGSIEDMPGLVLLITYPNCTFYPSGNISGFIDLATISLSVPSTITGLISSLTKLRQLQLYETNNLTVDNFTALTDLSLVYIRNNVLSTAVVNQLLADIWANRNIAKPLTLRSIDIFGSAGSGAPTGQGITDKAALEGYRTPNNDGQYSLWTIYTR